MSMDYYFRDIEGRATTEKPSMAVYVIFNQSDAFLHPDVNKSVTYHTNSGIIRRSDVLFHVNLTSKCS